MSSPWHICTVECMYRTGAPTVVASEPARDCCIAAASVPLRVEPALNPYQPNHKMKVPRISEDSTDKRKKAQS